ncbi:radical SAM protein [Kovacikia minuta CCNUW1]|uniref:B12-binding domain-containing radical SAM protein n=1 Tax=Kovacikia minuta TaxID=2931930 RepID=UPI001CC9A651|nr:radical SAM protein [Kovacikia minuta]UBF26000.1 radical SAM protein [Kovacikia minuta CCNUW1]
MGDVRVGLVQINNSFSNQNYLPYSVGLLQAYAQKYARTPDRYEFLLPVYRRLPIDAAVQHLEGADIVAFSTYVWNIKISLEIAKRLKQQAPETLIVFGGPQVPDRAEAFLRQHPFIDLVCHNEGEAVFLDILENYPANTWDGIGSISFLLPEGTFVHYPRRDRIEDLSLIPSPYLEGVFEPLIEANPQEQWIALWETNRGCPFSCAFCDWGSATQSKVYKFDLERLQREVDWFAQQKIQFVFCCDANFGILPRDLDIAQYVADTKRKYGYPAALSVQNTKNATERSYQVQKLLADSGLNKGVTIAMQSLDTETLKSIKRHNISLASFQELQRRFTQDNVETYTDIILGLPGETYDSFVEGVSRAIENGQHNRIQFNNLSILPNAEMGDPEYQQEYGMVTVESRIVNIHGSLVESKDEIYETQQLVIATSATPKEDWCKTRAFSWMVALLHFDKLLQIPIIVLREVCSFSYREIFEVFMERDFSSFPVLNEIRQFFWDKAKDIQNGGEEYCKSAEWLNIWWPADEYIFIKLSVEGKLNQFYREAEKLLNQFLSDRFIQIPVILHEAVLLNQNLVNQPFQTEDLTLDLSYNLWEFYQAIRRGIQIPLENQPRRYGIDRTSNTQKSWEDWYREVVWYGNKKGAYLYRNVTPTPDRMLQPDVPVAL